MLSNLFQHLFFHKILKTCNLNKKPVQHIAQGESLCKVSINQ